MVFVKSDAPEERDSTATASPHASSVSFCIAQLSDLHLFNPRNMKWQDFFSKRVLGYLSWRLHRQSEHQIDFMPALQKALTAAGVDHIAVTGDLTHLGHRADFESASQIMQQIGKPDSLTLIPGNHDAYIDEPWHDKIISLKAYISSDAGVGENLLTEPGGQPLQKAPILRKRSKSALIGVSSACSTPPFMATGTIGRRQLENLGKMLHQTADEALFRLILIHHPPISGEIGHRRRLTDHAAFAEIIRQTGAELILHGHTHRFEEADIDGPCGKIPVFGAPSLTALTGRKYRRAGFRLFRIQSADGGWKVEMVVYRYSLSQDEFIPTDTRWLSIPSQ